MSNNSNVHASFPTRCLGKLLLIHQDIEVEELTTFKSQ